MMKKKWLSILLCGAMVCSLLSPVTSYADGTDIGEWEPDIEEGVEDWEEDVQCKEHNWTQWTVVTEATCTEPGSETRSCKACGETETKTIEANGHTWSSTYTVDVEATCTTDGSKSIHCLAIGCLETQNTQVIPKLGHDFQNYESNGDATCTADGTKTAKCERCTVTNTVEDTGSKKNHTYATTWSKDDTNHWHACSSCGDKRDVQAHNYVGDICSECGYERAHMHVLKVVNAVEATCTANGSKAYYACSGCESIFEDKEGTKLISDRDVLVVNALGHDFALYTSNGDATCTADGTKTARCSRCDVIDTVADTGSAKGHTMTKVEAVAAKCETSGNKEYYTCSVCGGWFEDVAGKKAISDKNSVVVNAIGHAYATVWSKDDTNHWHECANCFAKKDQAAHTYSGETCSTCGYEKAHVHNLTEVKAVDATCIANGSKAYYECSGCESIFEDKEGTKVISDRNSLVVAAIGHEFKNYTSNGDATCTVDGTKTAKCERCSVTDTMVDTGSAKGHTASVGWSKDDSQHWHICSVCEVKMDQASHTFADETCSVCGYEKAHVHALTMVEAVDATCEKSGNIAYYTCSGCDGWFADAEGKVSITDKNSVVVGALGHSYDDKGICERCGQKDSSVPDKVESVIAFVNAKRTVDYTGNAVELSADDVLVTAGNGTITFTYYVDEECKVPTYKEDAKLAGKAPEEAGRYYVKAEISATATYNEDTTDDVFVLTIRPRKVTGAKVVNNMSSIKITWEKREEADGYIIYRRKKGTSSDSYKAIKIMKDNSNLAYADTNIKQGSAYIYTIRAYKDAEDGSRINGLMMSSAVKIVRTKVTSITNQNGSVKIKWTRVDGAAGYKVYRKSSGEDTYRRIQTIRDGEKNYYVDKNFKAVKNGKASYYYIKPYFEEDDGYVLTTDKKTNYYVSRNSVASVTGAKKAFTVKWKKNSKANGYQICYSTSKNFDSSKKVTVAGNSKISKKISSLKAGKKYYVKVRAYKTYKGVKYYSAWSSVKSVKTK